MRTVRLRAKIKAKFSKELEDEFRRLSALVENPALVHKLVKAAAAETLLAAYRKRFLANFSDTLNMQRSGKPRGTPSDTKGLRRTKEAVETLAQDITAAELAGHATGGLEKQLRKAEERLVEAYDKQFGNSDLSTGMFRPLALQVLGLLTTMAKAGEQATDSSFSLGIGHIPTLEAIKTPSATPFLTGNATRSPMNMLWRHLEFGTGMYAARVSNEGSKHKTQGGGWWFGPRPGKGLHLKGSKGVHALFDARGVPYEADALRFETVFANMLNRALHG
jgi:hypothetical protein